MLLASHFILNKTTSINEHVIYPFVHSSSNWRTAADMLRPISVPDVKPSDLPTYVDFSMVAGEVSWKAVFFAPVKKGEGVCLLTRRPNAPSTSSLV